MRHIHFAPFSNDTRLPEHQYSPYGINHKTGILSEKASKILFDGGRVSLELKGGLKTGVQALLDLQKDIFEAIE
jgi:hypothetical protein